MIDFGETTQIALAGVAIAGSVLVLRWLGGEEGASLSELFRIPLDPPLPPRVQEEEPQRWQLERLSRRQIGDRRSVGSEATRPAAAQRSASNDSISFAYHASNRSPDQPRTAVSS